MLNNQIKILPFCLLICSISLLTACKKLLSPDPVSSFDAEYVFDNIQNARSALYGAYMSLAGDYGYGARVSIVFPCDTDESIRGTSLNPNESQLICHYSAVAGNLQITNPFNQFYQGVERANMCIYYIPKMDLFANGNKIQQAQLKRMYGEALVLRANFLFELCRNWGDVPVQWQPSQFEKDLFKGRTNKDSIYAKLISDLAQAQNYLPWRTEVTSIGDPIDQRFTKGTAKALRAKIALTMGGYSLPITGGSLTRPANYLYYYQIARDECFDLLQNRNQHTLMPSYKTLFRDYLLAHNMHDPAGEFMMVASMAASGSGAITDSKLGIQNGSKVNGQGGGGVTILPTFFYMFDSTDERRDVNCIPYEITFDSIKTIHAANVIYDGKFRKEWVSNPSFIFSAGDSKTSSRPATNTLLQNMQLSFPLIRFADVLLWFAEAENELNNGPTPAAIAALTEVNLRGHGGTYNEAPPIIPTDKIGFFKFIVKERLLEFADEGIRRYDLVRWNLLKAAITETRVRLKNWANSLVGSHEAFTPFTYMEDFPSYARDAAKLPSYMYAYTKPTRSDVYDFNPYINSFYYPNASNSTPTGQTRVNWWIKGTYADVFANGFLSGKSELLPIPKPNETPILIYHLRILDIRSVTIVLIPQLLSESHFKSDTSM